MKWNLINHPLGMGYPSGTGQRKEIPIAIPLVLAAASVASSLYGASKSAKANKEVQEKLDAERTATEAERRRKKYESWTDTASGMNTIRMLRDEGDRAYKRMSGAAAVGGATEASVAAEKELQNLKQAEVIAQANANFEDKKDNIDASYRQQLSGLNQQQIALDQQKANNVAQAAQGVSSGLMQGAMATFGGTKLGQQWMGAGSPAGGGVSTPAQLQTMGGNYKVLNPYIYQYLTGKGYV